MDLSNTFIPGSNIHKQGMDAAWALLLKRWKAHMHPGIVYYDIVHPYFIYRYYKAFNMKNQACIISLHGKALCF